MTKLNIHHLLLMIGVGCSLFLSGCEEDVITKDYDDFLSKPEWNIDYIKYVHAVISTDGNAIYTGSVFSDIRYYNAGKIVNKDTAMNISGVDYNGPIMHLYATNDSVNVNDDILEIILYKDTEVGPGNDWHTMTWFGSRLNRAPIDDPAKEYYLDVRDADNGFTLYLKGENNPLDFEKLITIAIN
ncbi:MAG: hypothetical protein JXQ90_03695 [Cyclobacteriaceae bacterium]